MKINTATITEVDVASPADVELLSTKVASLESKPPVVSLATVDAISARVAVLESKRGEADHRHGIGDESDWPQRVSGRVQCVFVF
jgi:hypothetical protein